MVCIQVAGQELGADLPRGLNTIMEPVGRTEAQDLSWLLEDEEVNTFVSDEEELVRNKVMRHSPCLFDPSSGHTRCTQTVMHAFCLNYGHVAWLAST